MPSVKTCSIRTELIFMNIPCNSRLPSPLHLNPTEKKLHNIELRIDLLFIVVDETPLMLVLRQVHARVSSQQQKVRRRLHRPQSQCPVVQLPWQERRRTASEQQSIRGLAKHKTQQSRCACASEQMSESWCVPGATSGSQVPVLHTRLESGTPTGEPANGCWPSTQSPSPAAYMYIHSYYVQCSAPVLAFFFRLVHEIYRTIGTIARCAFPRWRRNSRRTLTLGTAHQRFHSSYWNLESDLIIFYKRLG